MSIRIDATAEYYLRTTNLPSIATFTLMAWVKLVTENSIDGPRPVFYRNDGAGDAAWIGVYLNRLGGAGLTQVSMDSTAVSITHSGENLTTGIWNHLTLTRSGNTYTTYIDGVIQITFTDASAITNTRLYLGGNDFTAATYPTFDLAAVKIWDGVALVPADIVNEMRQYMPVRGAGIHAVYPLLTTADDQIDYLNGFTATVGGTPTTSDGPPIPWAQGRRRMQGRGTAPPVVGGYVLVAN